MQSFKRTFAPIEAEIENIKGETVKVSSIKVFSMDVVNELEKLGLDVSGKTGSEMIVEQMIFVFGHDKQFYNQFEPTVLIQVIEYIQSEIYGLKAKKK